MGGSHHMGVLLTVLTGPADTVMVDLSCTNKAQRLEELGRGYEDCKY